jgi:hypothetical protein
MKLASSGDCGPSARLLSRRGHRSGKTRTDAPPRMRGRRGVEFALMARARHGGQPKRHSEFVGSRLIQRATRQVVAKLYSWRFEFAETNAADRRFLQSKAVGTILIAARARFRGSDDHRSSHPRDVASLVSVSGGCREPANSGVVAKIYTSRPLVCRRSCDNANSC